jgi:hypothetical protein
MAIFHQLRADTMQARAYSTNRGTAMRASALFLTLLLVSGAWSQTEPQAAHPVVVSAEMQRGVIVYRLNGRRVEESRKNSLLTNLGNVAGTRGLDVAVYIVMDVRAAFTEVGKLETALDKIGLTNHRLFVADFRDATMNEIHWDQDAIPIPLSTGR